MKKIVLCILLTGLFLAVKAQVTTVAGDYKAINIGTNGYRDYTRSLILLHQVYNGTLIEHNYAIGTITAMRGSAGGFDRINVVNVNTSSAYNGISGTINSYDSNNASWGLKTCIYNGNKYLAVDVPYLDAYHNWGYQFSGWTSSTGEGMKFVSYLVNGQPVNQTLISNIQDFVPNMVETHMTARFNITGNVGIGTANPNGYMLAVKGNVHAQQVTVDLNNWADYVFNKDYNLPSLMDVKAYTDQHHHLPGIPSGQEIAQDGLNLGEMNKLLMKKVEELTLYLIQEKEEDLVNRDRQKKLYEQQQQEINQLKKQLMANKPFVNE